MGSKVEKIDPKSTGGEGFDFEDKVGAYFISFLLTGHELYPTLNLGRLERICLQRKVEGWELDDFILDFQNAVNKPNVSLSVKSNSQITGKSAPSDLVEGLWKQFSKEGKNPFNMEKDFMGLVTSGSSTTAIETMRVLSKFAKRNGDENLEDFLKNEGFTNENVRSLLDSFEKPETVEVKDVLSKIDIIKKFIHVDMNLDDPSSADLQMAFKNLSEVLNGENVNELWIHLQSIVKTKRAVAGEINYNNLVADLSRIYDLKGHLSLSSDLERINKHTAIELEKIKSTIGDDLRIPRSTKEIEEIRHPGFYSLIGQSGTGKSSLLKQWVDKDKKQTVWIPYSYFKAKSLSEFYTLFGSDNSLDKVLKLGPSNITVVLDGIDRLASDEEIEILRSFLLDIRDYVKGRHSIVISCQDQIWKTLVLQLATKEIEFKIVSCPLLSDDELKFVSDRVKFLSGILVDSKSKEILRQVKYLDIVIKMIESKSVEENAAINESMLVEGFWTLVSELGKYPERLSVIVKLASIQADEYNFSTAISLFDVEEITVLKELEKRNYIVIENDFIRFFHDIYGDWLRLKFLLQDQDSLALAVEKSQNLFWHKAVTLFSLSIFDDQGLENWKITLEKLKSLNSDLTADLFLDIAITTQNAPVILEVLKETFFENENDLFKRFLNRFLAYATMPNPRIMSLREEWGISEISAAQIQRLPIYNYWAKVIIFVKSNLELFNNVVKESIAISEIWLKNTPNKFPLRDIAGEIVLYHNNRILNAKFSKDWYLIRDGIDKACFSALFASYPVNPSEAEDLILKFVGLSENQVKPKNVIKKEGVGKYSKTFDMFHKRIERVPWEYGPVFKKDNQFPKSVFKVDTFEILIKNNPELASKVLLASIIEEPKEYERYDELDIHDNLAIDRDHEFSPPFYTQGPFLKFFQLEPDIAIDCMINLTNFVTDRWVDREKKRKHNFHGVEIEINGIKKMWFGDGQVYWWSADTAHCPDVVVCFLMAFEKWIYNHLDEKKDIDRYIDKLLEKSYSMSVLGLLSVIGKKHLPLFQHKLKDLFSVEYFFWWDHSLLNQGDLGGFKYIGWSSEDSFLRKLAIEWGGMNHRKIYLEQVSTFYLLNDLKMKDHFNAIRVKWAKLVEANYDSQLDALVQKFNPNNYQIQKTEDGQEMAFYVPPKEYLAKNEERFSENDKNLMWLMFPYNAKKILEKESIHEDDISSLETVLETLKDYKGDEDHLHNMDDCRLTLNGIKLVSHYEKMVGLNASDLERIKVEIEQTLLEIWNDRSLLDFRFDQSDSKYDATLALVLGRIQSHCKTEEWFKRCVSSIICGPRSIPIKSFFQSSIQKNECDKFTLQSLNLLFEFSKYQTVLSEIENRFKYSYPDKEESFLRRYISKSKFIRTKLLKELTLDDRYEIFNTEVDSLIRKFVSGEMVASWPSWDYNPRAYRFAAHIEKFRDGVINLEFFTTSVSLLPSTSKWSEDLLKGWEKFINTGLKLLTLRLKKEIEKNGDIKGTPYNQDRFLISSFANTYLFQHSDKLDITLKDFLSVGEQGHYWLDDFGKELFRFVVDHKDKWDIYVERCKTALDIAETVPELSTGRWNNDKIWYSLIGLDSLNIRFLDASLIGLIDKLWPQVERLLMIRSTSLECLNQVIYLLLKDASINVRMNGLTLIAEKLKDQDFSDYSHERYVENYSYLLTKLWSEHLDDLKSNKGYLESFQDILKPLIAVQNPSALELAVHVNSIK